jgi:hypothetical protein
MQSLFLKLYDDTVNELFTFCLEKIGNRSIAKSIVDKTYAKQWDLIAEGYPIHSAKQNLYILASQFITEEESGTTPFIPSDPDFVARSIKFA